MTLTALEHTAVQERRAKNEPWQSIAVALGKNESALRRAVKRFDARHAAMPETQDAPPETVRSAPGLNTEAPAFESDDAPPPAVRHPAVGPRESARAQRLVTRLDGLEKILVIPDTHVPFEDGAAFAVMMAAARVFRPHRIVILGDFADCEAVSFHPKSTERGFTFKEEVDAVNARLDEIDAIGASVTFISGNHEHRIARYLRERAPELAEFVNAQGLYRIQERGWGWVPYQDDLKIGKMHFTHDIGKAGVNAHRESCRAYRGNVWIGHTHRFAQEISGSSVGSDHIGIMCGWLGDKRKISYMHRRVADQWTLGFGLAYHDRNTGHVHCVPTPIVDYRCVVEGQLIEPLKGTSVDERRVA